MTHFAGHEKANIALVARDETVFKARVLNLRARSVMFDEMAATPDLDDSKRVEGLPSLRIDADADALDIVLALIHDRPVLGAVEAEKWISAYALSHMWDAEGIQREIKKHLPLEGGTHGLALWRLAITVSDTELMNLTYQHALTNSFCKDPFSYVAEYGPEGVKIATRHLLARDRTTLHTLTAISTHLFSPDHSHCKTIVDEHKEESWTRDTVDGRIKSLYGALAQLAHKQGHLKASNLDDFLHQIPWKGCSLDLPNGQKCVDATCCLPALYQATKQAGQAADLEERDLTDHIQAWREK